MCVHSALWQRDHNKTNYVASVEGVDLKKIPRDLKVVINFPV